MRIDIELTQEYSYKTLKSFAKDLGETIVKISDCLLEDERFQSWSGSSRPDRHHYGDYGLIIHTCEVAKQVFATRLLYPQYEIDKTELFLAALFHDAGKIYDYEKIDGVWCSTDHKRIIHHISRSAIMWQKAILLMDDEFQERYADPVFHAILSHHGLREWGSPVAPKSRVAWLLFFCDGISARLYDADMVGHTTQKILV